jgi:hypothetical protein
MGCCKIDRSRRSRDVEIRVLDVAGFYRLLEDVEFVRVETELRNYGDSALN